MRHQLIRHVKEIFRAIQEIDRQLSANDLKPEEKVRIAINMTDVVTRICADGIRQNNPKITEQELISIMRCRFSIGREWSDERYHAVRKCKSQNPSQESKRSRHTSYLTT